MDPKQRIEYIRKGNDLFNKGEIDKAAVIFEKTGYKDGLTRVGDHLYFDKKQPLFAFKYYKMAGRQDMIDEIFARMVFALGKLIRNEDEKPPEEVRVNLPPLKVSPKLKIFAEEILRQHGDSADS